MLLLTFRAGGELYAVDARGVVEVVPRVAPRKVPHAPDYLLGLLAYRGRVVPMIDFGILTGSGPSREALSTRTIVAEFRARDGRDALVALVAEGVDRVRHVGEAEAVSPGMRLEAAPYLGAVFRLEDGLVQLVEPGKLLSETDERALYGDPTEPG